MHGCLDGTAEQLVDGRGVLVRDGKITGFSSNIAAEGGVSVLDADGFTHRHDEEGESGLPAIEGLAGAQPRGDEQDGPLLSLTGLALQSAPEAAAR